MSIKIINIKLMKKLLFVLKLTIGSLFFSFGQSPTVGIWYSTWYTNNGHYIWIDGHGVGSNNQFLDDVNGDGKDDAIVYFGNAGAWYVALSNGNYYTGYSQWKNGHGIGSDQQFVADFSGDGKADALVLFNSSGAVYVATSNGTGFNSYSQWGTNFGIGASKIMAGDANGDNKIDLIAYYASTGTWKVALSNGSSFGSSITWITGHGVGSSQQYSGDFNGDGKADALVIFTSGDGYVSLSNGTSLGGYSKWCTGVLTGGSTVLMGDVDGDLKEDIIFYSSDGSWYVSYASSNNTFGSQQIWKLAHTANAGNVFVGDPLGDNNLDAVGYMTGVWNILPNSNDYVKPLRWNLWDAWAIKYLPLTLGTYQQYDSGDSLVIREHLAEISDANIDYLLMDETNYIHTEGNIIFNRAQKVAQEIKKWNNDSINKKIFYAYAVGGMQFSGNPNTLEDEAEDVWFNVVNNASNGGANNYFHLDGKPLLVCYYGQQSYLDAWNAMQSHPWTQYFTIRWCTGTNSSTPDLYGWGIPNGSINSSTLMEVMPGWNNHKGSFVSRTYNGVEGGFYKELCWDRVLTQLPGTVIINSYNEFAEETAVQITNTSNLTGSSEAWSTPDKYWDMTVDYIDQYRTEKANQLKSASIPFKSKNKDENEFLIFPNPISNGEFTISCKETNLPYSIVIFNIEGKLVYKRDRILGNFKVNEPLGKGLHFVNITTDNTSKTMKLLVR